jgi:phosphinothricin acetyltransferase
MVRLPTAEDAAAIAAIYAPIVNATPISFEESAPGVDEMRRRILGTLEKYPWLVLEDDGVEGYAYATAHRARAAYRWSVEVSAYVREDARGRGVATKLYRALFAILKAQGFHRALAGVGLPNPASVALHLACGFEPVGIFREIGFKLGAWHDTQWFQRELAAAAKLPSEPIPLPELAGVSELLSASARPDESRSHPPHS